MCVFTPPAHIQCHHSSNQPPHGCDGKINHPINASLHSVRLRTSKYLPMQNNPRGLDDHFKLSPCIEHNQDKGGLGGWGWGLWGKTVTSFPFYANTQHTNMHVDVHGREGWEQNTENHRSLVDLVSEPLSHRMHGRNLSLLYWQMQCWGKKYIKKTTEINPSDAVTSKKSVEHMNTSERW